MKIDINLLAADISQMPKLVNAAETLDFDGMWVAETAHDPFLPLALAAEHSHTITLGTGIAVAFARSPATLAYQAWDLARYSRGRFVLGLGTQVKAHIERRFGAVWDRPAARLRETILALRHFWDCWQNGTRLNFRGEFFKLTLMSPFFDPGPHDFPDIPIYIAGVNHRMCQLAGELCQGLHVHPLHTPAYLQQAIWPSVQQGLQSSGRTPKDIELCGSVFVIPTDVPQQTAQIEADVRRQIAFYASTPAYRAVMETHGWEATAAHLSELASRKQWAAMPALITEEMLAAFAVSGRWAELPQKITTRYSGGLLNRVSYYLPFVPGQNDANWQATVTGFKTG